MMEVNFYNFAKMSIHEEFPTNQRIGKKDPIKYKHRMFYKGASLEQIESIQRSTSPHQIQELQATIASVNEQIAIIVENKRMVREKIAKTRQVLNQCITNDTVMKTAVGNENDEDADATVRVAPEETNEEHADVATESTSVDNHHVPVSDISFEFETLEPNEEDIAMFFEVPMDETASDIVDLSDLNSTFDCTTGI